MLLVSFGGINKAPGMPVLEFKNVLEDTDIHKEYIVDPYQAWYYKGIDRIINTHFRLAVYLDSLIKQYGKDYTVFVGNSMGAFAAILFGSILHVDRVVAFAPQTFLDKELREKNHDSRWQKHIVKLQKEYPEKDLRLSNLLDKNNTHTKFDVYFGYFDALDLAHSRRLLYEPNFNLYPFPGEDGHSLVKTLRDQGILKHIIMGDVCKTDI